MSTKPLPVTGPYKGLVPYSDSEEDARLFFGRDADRKVITANLLGSRLTLLYGASGVGKSSVLRAGVAYHLRLLARENREETGVPEVAVVVFDAWHEDPLSALINAIGNSVSKALSDASGELLAPAPADLCATLRSWTQRLNGDLLIVLDQFEEYFLHEKQGNEVFATEFVRVVNASNLRVNFLISIREDALASLDRFKGQVPALFENYLRLEHLDRASAQEAIEKPLDAWSLDPGTGPRLIEQGLVEAVLNQISARRADVGRPVPGPESFVGEGWIEAPVLQVVMTRLWEEEIRARSSRLRLETLKRLEDSEKIFRDYLNDRLQGLFWREAKDAGRLFRQLVGSGGERSAVSAKTLADRANLPLHRVESVLEELKERGLLVVRSSGTARFEVPHDILSRAIQQEFDKRRRNARDLWRNIVTWGLALLVFVLATGWASWTKRNEDQKSLAAAERLAAKALYYSDRRLDLALLLAAQAGRTRDSGEVRNGLLSTLQKVPRLEAFLQGNPNGLSSLALDPIGGMLAAGTADGHVQFWDLSMRRVTGPPLDAHADGTRVSGLAFYPGGSGGAGLATAGEDGSIYLWDLHRRRSRALIEPPSELERKNRGFSGLAVSADGRLLAAGVVNGTVLLWNLEEWDLEHGSRRPRRLETGGGEWPVVAFSPNGRILAVGSPDGAVRLYRASGRPIVKLMGNSGAVVSLAVDPRGRLLAAGTRTGKVLLWRLDNRRPMGDPISAHDGEVWSLAFSPQGESLATGGADRRVRLWTWSEESPRLQAGGDPLTGGHVAGVRGLVFSNDGQTLASSSDDGRVCLWSMEEHPPLGTRLGKVDGGIEKVAFSPDGQLLASGGADGRVRLWDLDQRKKIDEAPPSGALWSLAFSPDGSTVAAGGASGKVRLWQFGRQHSAVLEPRYPSSRGIEGLAFAPDGRALAWADLDWTIRRWSLRDRRPLPSLIGHRAGVWDVAFSPDGKNLASSGEDTTVRIWDLSQGEQIGNPLTGHSRGVVTVAYSPDGETLASGGLDGRLLLWDVQRRQPIGSLLDGHSGGVSALAFSPDGSLLASCGRDKSVRLWSCPTRQPLGDGLRGHRGEVKSVAFRPDGTLLASSDSEGDLYLWDVDFDSWLSKACIKANRNLSEDEWRQLVDSEAPYEKTCPDLPLGEGVPLDSVSPNKE